jgi:hypothetical protein
MPSDTIEWHIKNAYTKSFYFFDNEIPDLFDIYDLFRDDLYETGKRIFVSEIYGLHQGIDEITIELVQDALIKMKMEFTNIEGEHLGCCQNILLEDWGG